MTAARSVVVRLDLETAQAIARSREFGTEMTRSMDQAEGSTRRTGAALDDLGGKAGRLAIGGVAALGSIAAAAIGWESAWAGVTKTVDGSASEMAQLEGDLRDLATTLPATHDEIAGVAEAAGQLGVAREDLVDFTETMVNLGETTNLTAEDAATSIAQMTNVMGTAPEDIDNLGASLVALGNDGASTERQIIEMAQRISGAAAQVGLAETDVLALANAAASMGIEVEAGGSSISRVFATMAKATKDGGAELETFAEVSGLTSQQFIRNFENDPARAFAAFTSGLDRINQSGGNVFGTLDELGLSDIRVSQALLSMAAAGDLLTDSLDLGADAWEENTALAIEAAKRYDTTAAEVQVSWNKIKDAGIEAGETLLPVISGIADKVGTIADAFGSLPDPVQGATTRLVAIGTLTAGAAWLGASVISKVSSIRESIGDLDTTSTKTGRSIGTMGRAASVAAAALAALAIVDALQGGMEDTSIGVESMTRSLLELDEAASLPDNLDGLADSVDRLANPNKAQALQDNIAGVIGFGGGSELAGAQSQIEALDSALSNLVTTAGADTAADQFTKLAEAAGLSEGETEDLMSLLPGYKEALAGVENEAKLTAEAHEDIDDGARLAANGITYSAEQIEAAQASYEDAVEGAQDVARSFVNLGDKVDKTKVSLNGWIKSLEDQADALRNFRLNAEEAAKKGLDEGLIASLQEAGPEGALRMRQLANATDAEIDRANRAWQRGEAEIAKYVEATTEVPDALVTRVSVEAQAAREELYRLREFQIGDKTITIHTVHAGGAEPAALSGGQRGADGMTVPGRLQPYGDRTMILAAPGEEVVSNRYGQADRHRSLLKAISANRYADGGTVGWPTSNSGWLRTGPGSGGTMTIIRQAAPLIENLEVPAMPGSTRADVDYVVESVVTAVSLAQRSGRWDQEDF